MLSHYRQFHSARQNFILAVTLILFIISCSNREHANPFDPDNPDTKGAPTNFRIYSNQKIVSLSWRSIDVDDLSFYSIHRSVNENLIPYDTVENYQNSYYDNDVIFDKKYKYAVQAHTIFDDGTLSDTLEIIPGPRNFWISDFYSQSISRISYDGAHLISSMYMDSPIAIEAMDSNIYLIADYWGCFIKKIDRNLSLLLTINLEGHPLQIQTNPVNSEFFVLQKEPNQLLVYSYSGEIKQIVHLPVTFGFDASLSYDRINSILWLSDYWQDKIYIIDFSLSDPEIQSHKEILNPRALISDPVTGGCWVASDTGIVKINGSAETTYKKNHIIYDIDINTMNGDCYYTGYNLTTQMQSTGRLVADQNYTDNAILGDNYKYLRKIKVLPGQDSKGFLVMQAGSWRIIRFDSDGNQMGKMTSFNAFIDIALE